MEECQQVSDVGVLALSNHCHDLEKLNLSRTNLLFKITDVSLLALGERCPMLQVCGLVAIYITALSPCLPRYAKLQFLKAKCVCLLLALDDTGAQVS